MQQQCYFKEFEIRGGGIDKCLGGGLNMRKALIYIKNFKKLKDLHWKTFKKLKDFTELGVGGGVVSQLGGIYPS